MIHSASIPLAHAQDPEPVQPALEVRDLSVLYRHTHALDNISLQVQAGTRVALVGPNGAGKSTLLKTIVGLVKPTSGTIRIAGNGLSRGSAVAYVPQRAMVDWNFPVTVRDVVMMGRIGQIGLLRLPRRQDRAQVQASLEQVRMADLAHRQIGQLSGGQQQRVFLARALAQQAQVLLLDEPFTGLDIRSQDELLQIIEGIYAMGVTVLVATHDLQQAADTQHYEQVVLLNRRLIASGRASDVLTPAHLAEAYGTHLHRVNTPEGAILLHDRH
jgi:ABC-type Mn2+/Zn2+ transport system ATPase subunit